MATTACLPDPNLLGDSRAPIAVADVSGRTRRDVIINPAQKTLVLITAGQSNSANRSPTLYTPTNTNVIHNLNVYDGAFYAVTGPLLGCDGVSLPGNLAARVADMFVTNGRFDQVIIVPLAIGATTVDAWATGAYKDRIKVAMSRLAARGITPATTGVTFAIEWGQGESDKIAGTSQAAYTASLNTVIANAQAAGFSGRFFVRLSTYESGGTSSAVRAAQAAVVNGTTVFQSGDTDTLTSGSRQVDNQHFSDAGSSSAATLIYNAMHASGGLF